MALENRVKLIIDTGKMWSGVLISQLIAVLRGIIIPRLLSPIDYGIIGALSLPVNYSQYLDLGFHRTMKREIPRLAGKGDEEGIERVKGGTMRVNIFTVIIYSIALLFYGILFVRNRVVLLGLVAIIIFILFSRFQQFLRTIFESRQRFGVVSFSNILFAILTLIILIPLVYLKGLIGYFIGIVFCGIIVFLYLFLKREEKIPLGSDWSTIKSLSKIGIPMFLMGIGGTLLTTIDRIMVIKFLSRADLGFYTMAGTVALFLISLPANVSKVIGPTIFETWGRYEDINRLKLFALKPISSITVITGLTISTTILLMPIIFQVLLPRYMPAVYPCAILLLGVYIRSTGVGIGEVLIALNKQMKMFMFQSICLAIAVGLIYYFIHNEWGLIGVALGEVITLFIYYVILFSYTGCLLNFNWEDILWLIFDTLLPLSVFAIATYYIMNNILSPPYIDIQGFHPHIIVALKRMGILIITSIPLFVYAQWRSRFFTTLFAGLKTILKRR